MRTCVYILDWQVGINRVIKSRHKRLSRTEFNRGGVGILQGEVWTSRTHLDCGEGEGRRRFTGLQPLHTTATGRKQEGSGRNCTLQMDGRRVAALSDVFSRQPLGNVRGSAQCQSVEPYPFQRATPKFTNIKQFCSPQGILVGTLSTWTQLSTLLISTSTTIQKNHNKLVFLLPAPNFLLSAGVGAWLSSLLVLEGGGEEEEEMKRKWRGFVRGSRCDRIVWGGEQRGGQGLAKRSHFISQGSPFAPPPPIHPPSCHSLAAFPSPLTRGATEAGAALAGQH
ncbi:hypothetical protein FQN60_005478 [Etheostoma spectabile]|uniref:Uncharacterized protein n=1 Tax=Etheostoma spectabile TaxID=54343 RepID=A0A5J5CFZ2_9PERO|nr:hypothetical protein FQN60_005478 [Etheostoma spectabile]